MSRSSKTSDHHHRLRFTSRSIATIVSASLVIGGTTVAAAAPATAAPGVAYAGFTAKDALRSEGRAIVQSGVLPVVDDSVPAGSGTTYYVDSTAGDDAASGTSTAAAWKSFANVNDREFEPGDRILLRAGSSWSAAGSSIAREAYDYTTWSGEVGTDVEGGEASALLAPGGSGTAEHPIVLSSYGDGAAPELNGRGVVNDVLQLTNQSHWDISNLEISNIAEGFDPTAFTPASANGQIPGQEDPLTGDVRGIHVQGENAGRLSGFDIHGVFIRDVSGVSWSVSGSGLDRSKRTGGILFEGLKGDGQTVSQFDGVSVRDNVIANTSFANLTFKQFAGMGTNRYQDRAPGWGDRAVAKAAPDGTITEDPNWRPHTGIEISGNYLSNRGTQYGWDSMYLTSVQGVTVADNLVDGAGVSGIEMYYADDLVVENNEVAEIELRPGAADSNGIDPDRGTSNVLIQHNYVHHSGEGILLCGFGFSTAIVRYNVIQDVDKNYVNPHGDSGVNVIYNNLMYNTQKPTRNNTVGFFESSGSATDYLVAKNPHWVIGNVFVNTRADVAGSAFRAGLPGVTFSDNSYYGVKVTAPTQDPRSTTSDPLLGGDPATDIENVIPTSGLSPLIGAGATVDLGAIAPGMNVTGNTGATALPLTVDFFGAPITTPTNIGPASYTPPAGSAVVHGIVTDAEGLPVAGANVTGDGITATSDARGRYAAEIASGGYTLTVQATGYADGSPTAVTLGSRATVVANLTLGETTATTGTVGGIVSSAGRGIAASTVVIEKDGTAVDEATTAPDGSYSFSDVPKGGGYTVTATATGYEEAARDGVTVVAARTTTVDLVLSKIVGETVYAVHETFDDEATGTFEITTDGVLRARPATNVGTIAIVDDAADAGNKYLRIHKSSASSAVLGVHNTSELNLTGTVTIEARVQRTTTNGTPNQLALYSYTESNWNESAPASSANPAATFGLAGGKIITHNVTGSSAVKQVADYQVGRWYTVRNVVDVGAGTFDFYIDDMSTPVLTNQPLRTKVDDLDQFLFFINGSNVGDLLVDYFRVNTGKAYDYGDATLAKVNVDADGDVPLSVSDTTYSGVVDAYTDAVAVSVAPTSAFATVRVNGQAVDAATPVDVTLAVGAQDDADFVTEIPVEVTAEDGTVKAYTVVISRTNPNQIAGLRDLTVTGFMLSPKFAPDRKGEANPYVIETMIPAGTAAVSLVWERGWTGQQVQVNGEVLPAGATTAQVPLRDGGNTIEVTADSFPGDFGTYVITLTREASEPAPDVVKPTTALVSPTTVGPFRDVTIQVDAADDRGLSRIVANIYRGMTLVKSTQAAVAGALTGTHTATVALPDGDYTIRYNAQDQAGNIAQTRTFAITVDRTAPTATVKMGASETVGADGTYSKVSFKLYDAKKIDKITLNGVTKDLSDNAWSDLNYVVPGQFGAVRGINTLVIFDLAGNTSSHTFTLE